MLFDWRDRRVMTLVVDMQATFIAPDGPFRNTVMDPVIGRLNGFLDECRQRRVPVVFSNYVLRADRSDAGLLRDSPFLEHLLESSPAIGVDSRLRRLATEPVLTHHRPSAFHDTNLPAVMARLSVDALMLTGVSINNAISATARDAFARDMPVLVVRDCCAAAPFEPHAEIDAYFRALDTWTADVLGADGVWERIAREA